MRWIAAIVCLALVSSPTTAGAQEAETPPEEVRLLAPADDRVTPGRRGAQSGWARIRSVDPNLGFAVLSNAMRAAGPDFIIENRYELSGPEDEPLFPDQWALENAGQTGGVVDADIDASLSWSASTGSGVVVAVIDSGIDASHPDLVGQTWTNPNEVVNGIDDDGNGFVDDVLGWDTVDWDGDPSPAGSGLEAAHGTMVAGLIGGAVNGVGMTGVAPDAKLMNLRACSNNTCWSLDVADAIFYAVDNGADVINLSLGDADTSDPPMESAINYARQHGVVVVAAIGNDSLDADSLPGGQIVIPADLPVDNIISVGSSNDRDQRAGFSNYGSSSVDVFAPGEGLVTAGTAGLPDYVLADGTSFSTAIVSGIVAQLHSLDSGARYRELIARTVAFSDRPSSLGGLSRNGRVNAGDTMTKRFADTSGSVFVNAIDWIEDRSITEGCNPPENHLYCPTGKVTRGEMAVFFARAFSLPAASSDYFTDDAGRFYEGAANRMFEAGITVGCGGTRYCGEREITRDELAAMLARVLSLPATPTDYFTDDAGSIFEGAINKIAEAGITNGCNPPTSDNYCPTSKVTRGEMSAFLKRAVEYLGS